MTDELVEVPANAGTETGLVPLPPIKRGASEGPLKDLIPVFIDIEAHLDVESGISLKSQTLRQYIASSWMTAIAIALGYEPPDAYLPGSGKDFSPEEIASIIGVLSALARDPRYVFVAHNAAFDIRYLKHKYGMPQPINVWCTLEGAMGAWPEMPGGYSLMNLCERLNFPKDKRKLHIDLNVGAYSQEELKIYNARDVSAMQELYIRQIARLPAVEQRIALLTHGVRANYFLVDLERLDQLITTLDKNAREAQFHAVDLKMTATDPDYKFIASDDELDVDGVPVLSTDDIDEIFNRTGPTNALKSIRGSRLIKVIQQRFGVKLPTTSLKKLSPVWQAKHGKIVELLRQTTRANKMLSYQRRSKFLANVPEIDTELGYMRACTGRFSSPGVGKSLNLHNCVSAFSLILTRRGWIPIVALNEDDQVWDSRQFTNFSGVTYEGRRSTMAVGVAEITPEQPVSTGEQRVPAIALTHYQLVQCLAHGLSSSLRGILALESEFAATDAALKAYEALTTSLSPSDAEDALIAGRHELVKSWTDCPRMTLNSSVGDSAPCSAAVMDIPIKTSNRSRKADTGLEFATNGWLSRKPTSSTSRRYLAGMIDLLTSIASITSKDTSREISASLRLKLTSIIAAILSGYRAEKHSWTTVSGSALNMAPGTRVTRADVFDIRGAGPRERFIADGVVTFNCPKHDISIAKPVREIFKLPHDKCFVRGDLSNVEYRAEGWLCDCKTIIEMFDPAFGGDLFADPYCKGWKSMTGVEITRKDPVRQVSKAATLGLGFIMSAFGFAQVLLRTCADPKSKTTEATLNTMIMDLRWPAPPDMALKTIYDRTGCSPTIAVTAWNVHRLFNAAHPEFGRVAEWLVRCVDVVASVGDARFTKDPFARFHRAQFLLDEMAQSTRAPDPKKIKLYIDDDYRADSPSIRIACGPWPATVCWREPLVRSNKFVDNGKPRLCVLKANGTEKTFTKQLAIENVTQAAARNALCYGLLRLRDEHGVDNVLHVHDEVLLIVDKNREAVLKAKQQLIDVFGPEANNPLQWAILIKPSEISITQSLWEDEDDLKHEFDKEKQIWKGNNRWGKIEAGTADMFDSLP